MRTTVAGLQDLFTALEDEAKATGLVETLLDSPAAPTVRACRLRGTASRGPRPSWHVRLTLPRWLSAPACPQWTNGTFTNNADCSPADRTLPGIDPMPHVIDLMGHLGMSSRHTENA